jgi:hypothetical protein
MTDKTPTPTEEKCIKLANELGRYCFKKIKKEVHKDKDMDFKEALVFLTGLIIENTIYVEIIDASIKDHIPNEEMHHIVNDLKVLFDECITQGLERGLEYLKFMEEEIKAIRKKEMRDDNKIV